MSEQIRAICIDAFVQKEKVDQGYGELHENQVAVVAFGRCVVLATAQLHLLRGVGGDCRHCRRSDSRCAIGGRDRRDLRPCCIPRWQWLSWCADADLGPIHLFQIIAPAIDDLSLSLVHTI